MNSFLLAQFPNRLSLSQAAQLSGYHQDYLSRLCRSGQIKALKIGRNWYTTKTELENFLLDENIISSDPEQQDTDTSLGDLSESVAQDQDQDIDEMPNVSVGKKILVQQKTVDGLRPVVVQNVMVNRITEQPVWPLSIKPKTHSSVFADQSDKVTEDIKAVAQNSTHNNGATHTVQVMIARMKLDDLQKNILQNVADVKELNHRVDEHSQILARHEEILQHRNDLRHAYTGALEMEDVVSKVPYTYEQDLQQPIFVGARPWILQTTAWVTVVAVALISASGLFYGLAGVQNLPSQTTVYYPSLDKTNLNNDQFAGIETQDNNELIPQVAGDSVIAEPSTLSP
ncbi:MAG: helix-turn-helix domain-containing protein [Candidatus Doudnabacteria bacterium]